MQDNNNLVVIIEDTQTKLQSLLSTAITSNLQREIIGAQAKQLINTCLNELKNKGADSDFINKVERGFKASFLRWYNNTLKMLLEGVKKGNPIFYTSYTKITGVEPKIKGKSIIINIDGKDNFELGGVKNIRDYFTTGETGYSQMFIEDYQKRVNQEITKIASSNVVLRDSLNRHLSVRNLAEMQVRYEEQVKDIDRLNKNGVEFVYASSHANASKRCQPWQGKLFKLDIKSFDGKPGKYDPTYTPKVKGTIDGKDYYSLADAFNHGFLGYNCRHHLIAYKKGMTPPKQYEARKVENERNKELNIRQMERQIRTAKRKAMLASNKEERKKWTEASKALQDTYWDYCKKNNYAVAEWRTRISLNEREGMASGLISGGNNEYIPNKYFNGGSSGNLEQEEEIIIADEVDINPVVKTKEYSDILKSHFENKDVAQEVAKGARTIFNSGKVKRVESVYLIDKNKLKESYYNPNGKPQSIVIDKNGKELYKNITDGILIHNHRGNTPPSYQDLYACYRRSKYENKKMEYLILTNNGKVYYYKNVDFFSERVYNEFVGSENPEKMEQGLFKLAKEMGFTFERWK